MQTQAQGGWLSKPLLEQRRHKALQLQYHKQRRGHKGSDKGQTVVFLSLDLFIFSSICLPAALPDALHNVDSTVQIGCYDEFLWAFICHW